MTLRIERLLITVILASCLAGCGKPVPGTAVFPTMDVSASLPGTVSTPSGAGTLTSVGSPSPSQSQSSSLLPASPTPALIPPVASVTPLQAPVPPSPAPVMIDLSLAKLRLENLPKGFQVLDEKSQAQAGLAPETIRQSFSGIFRQAELIHSFAYVTSDPRAFEIVVGLVFSPILSVEQPSFDQMLVDPNGAIKNFAKSFGGEARVLANLPNVGQSRSGWSFTTSSGTPPLKGEMVIARRDTIVALLLTMFPSDQRPAAPVVSLAPILDANMKKALGK